MLAHVLWAGVVTFGIWRFAQVLEKFAPVSKIEDSPVIPPMVEVPEDLVGMAMLEREPWAQEELLRAMRERYEDLQDWNLVRSAFGVAPTP